MFENNTLIIFLGHWKTTCWNLNIKYFELVFREGYEESVCDCMICPVLLDPSDKLLNGGPFVAR